MSLQSYGGKSPQSLQSYGGKSPHTMSKTYIIMCHLNHNKRQKIFSEKLNLVMACHIRIIPPLEKAKKQEMPLTRLSPIPLKNVDFRVGMGLSLVNDISCFLAFSRGGIIRM